MEVVISENDQTIKTIVVNAPIKISDMIESLEDFRQKINMFFTEKIEENGILEDDLEADIDSSEDDEEKVPISPKKRKKLP